MAKLDLTLGEVRELIGDGVIFGHADFRCREIAGLDLAGADDLSFVKSVKHLASAESSGAGALLVPEALGGVDAHQLVLPDPVAGLSRVLEWIATQQRAETPGIHPKASIADSVTLGEGVTVGPGAVLREGVVVGDRTVIHANVFVGRRSMIGEACVLHPNAVLREDIVLGDRVTVHAGAVIGSDGYGFQSTTAGHQRIPQVGSVVVGDDVEVGALATIDRATLDQTVIGRGTKIGDMVHVGHNCRIGKNVMLLPLTAISGSVKIGDGVIFAGRSGAADNLEIGAGARIGATSVVFKDVPEGVELWGSPARGKLEAMRIESLQGKLPELFRKVGELADRADAGRKEAVSEAAVESEL